MAACLAQKTKAEQGGKSAEHSTIGNIIAAFKAHRSLIQGSQGRRHPLHAAGGSHSHGRFSIGHAAFPLIAWGGLPESLIHRARRHDHIPGFFFNRPARIALWIVLGKTPSCLPMAGTSIPALSNA